MALDSTVRLSTQTECVLIGLEGLSFYTVLFPWSLPGMCLTFFFLNFQRGIYNVCVSMRTVNCMLSLVPNQITNSAQSLSPISLPLHWCFIIFLTQRSQTARLGIS